MNELTIEGVESAIILAFPKTRTERELQASIDLVTELRGYPVTIVAQANARARNLVALGMHINDAVDRALKWARGAVREPEGVA